MEKHIIFFDIDGTLYNENKELPDSAKKSIKQLQENGHEVAIATGRAPFMFKDLREELGIHTYVSFNGQYVVLNGEVIYRNPLNHDSLKKLTELAIEREHPVVYMDQEDMKANVPSHDYIEQSIGTLKVGRQPTYAPDYYLDRPIYQSLLFCEEGEERVFEETFEDFQLIRWHKLSVDVIPANGSKAEGIEKITSALNIASEQQVAFGDSLNDLEMLHSITHSVAMGNGHERAKNAAKHVTTSASDDGIKNGLKHLGLLE
ncbi:Cof-type HAD-IIB family hydrolase [Halalkalibacillus halophilus]|uniref:Cof-type HAD-IIB family hydrolase n=1 Tax=Halalkalibacillus halophilus TaxID=392827 RepID=UPI00040A631A|nr:Cof-type HAD-IIB family hydrolase [Halalkalibacillus halophilus]